jgi:hypothetical protein
VNVAVITLKGKNMKTLVATLFAISFSSVCLANNSYFLQSDAFFFTRVGEETVAELQESTTYDFSYGSKGRGGRGCGDLGYFNLKIENLTQETATSFADCRRRLTPLLESDGMMNVFVYALDYDWKKFGIGMQYNESWVNESLQFGAHEDHVILGTFSNSQSQIMRNWRDSHRVPPLGAICPELPKGHQQSWRESPATIDASKVKFLIIPDRKFNEYINHTDSHDRVIVELSSGKMTVFKYSNGNWEEQ